MPRVSWEARLTGLFDDLESQAEGLALTARDADVADLGRSEYAEVDLAGRLHASVGLVVRLELTGWGRRGVLLQRVGAGCALVTEVEAVATPSSVVNLDHLLGVSGLAAGTRPEALRRVTARLGLASALRHLSEDVGAVCVVRPDGTKRQGTLARLGADFVELAPPDARVLEVVPLSAVVAVSPVTGWI